jgi:site-specific recombinase XerD
LAFLGRFGAVAQAIKGQTFKACLVTQSSAESLFVSKNGRRLGPNYVSNLVKKYLNGIGIKQRGSCHLLRHTAATLMMENGADLRSLQQFLGHARLNTTQIYTHVSIQRLQEVHRKTHPAKPNGKPSSSEDEPKTKGNGGTQPKGNHGKGDTTSEAG